MSHNNPSIPTCAAGGRRRPAPMTLLATALTVVVLAGTGLACAPAESDSSAPCDIESVREELSDDERAETRPSVSVEIDITRSAKKRRDELAAAITEAVVFAADNGARLSIGTFGATRSSAGPVACLENVVLVPDGNNGDRREENLRNMPGEITDMALAAVEASPREDASDPVAGFIAGADDAHRLASGAADTVVILSDFVATTGCLAPDPDLPSPDPAEIAGWCSDLPDMEDLDVAVAAVGRSDPQPSTEQVDHLIAIAEHVCEGTGATCTVTGSHLPELDR